MNKSTILTGWNLMRIIRLIFGIVIIVHSIKQHQFLFGLLGLLFAGMAVFNIGCCVAGGCGVPTNKNKNTSTEISYEEVV